MSGYPPQGPGAGPGPADGRRPVIINAYPNNGSTLPRRNQTLTRPDRQPTLRRPLMRTIDRPPPAARAGKYIYFLKEKRTLYVYLNNKFNF